MSQLNCIQFSQGVLINFFVYFGYIKNIFGSDVDNDYRLLSSKLQVISNGYIYSTDSICLIQQQNFIFAGLPHLYRDVYSGYSAQIQFPSRPIPH